MSTRSRPFLRHLAILLVVLIANPLASAVAGTVRVKVVTVYSPDPDDDFADRVELIPFTIGAVSGTTGDNDDTTPVGDNNGDGEDDGSGIARVVAPGGDQIVSVPKAFLDSGIGLVGKLRVGSIRIEATATAEGKLCAPSTNPEGNVSFDFDENVDHSSASDYTVAIRLVPRDAAPASAAEDCGGGGDGGAGAKAALKCKRTVAKASSDFVQARLKALTACEDDKHAGKLPQNLDCRTESEARDAITKASNTLRKKIAKDCGGSDKTCGGDADGEIVPSALGFPAVCPGFRGAGCTNPLTTCEGLADCLICIDGKAVDSAMAASTPVGFADAKLQKQLHKCQRTILKSATALTIAYDKSVHKCRDKNLLRKDYNPLLHNTCTSGLNDELGDAFTKMKKAICKACGGNEEKGCGGADDFTPNDIAYPMTCPNPDASCARPITALDDILSCVFCRAARNVECTQDLTTSSLAEVVYDCAPVQ